VGTNGHAHGNPFAVLALEAIRVDASPSANAREGKEIASEVTIAFSKREPHGALSSLHARDWALLAHERGRGFAAAPAAFVRKSDALVCRLGNFTAIVSKSTCYFMEKRAATARNASEALGARVKAERGSEEGAAGFDFPLAALECALEESSRYFEAKLFRLRRLAKHCVEDISKDLRGDDKFGIVSGAMLNYSASQFQKLPPVRRAVVALEHDAREALDALNRATTMELAGGEGVLPLSGDDVTTEIDNEERSEAVLDLLASHQRRMAAVGGLVQELTANLDAARELWELQLDGDRNRTEQMNFRATVVAMSAATAAVPAALGGMNLPHGFENAPSGLFFSIATLVGATAFWQWYSFMRRFKKAGEITTARANELASMHYILSNMDTLDDAFDSRAQRGDASASVVTREALLAAMTSMPGEEATTVPDANEVYNLLKRVFDKNNSSRIELAEWRQKV